MSISGPMTLPKGWTSAPLATLVDLNPRQLTTELTDEDSVSFVPMSAVEASSGRLDPSQIRSWKDVKKGYTPFQDGDVLFAKITPCMENGKFAVATGLFGGRGVGSTEYHVLRPTAAIHPRLLLYFLLQRSFRAQARAEMRGAAGQLRVPAKFFENVSFPLPPLPEQHRIVAAIEQQFTRLDAAVADLRQARAKLKRYRAAVLAAACSGRIVSCGEQLTDHDDALCSDGGTPKHWRTAKVGDLAKVCTGATPLRSKATYYRDGKIPWVTSGALNNPFVREASEFVTDLALRETNLTLFPVHSLLVAMYGEGRTRGRCSELMIEATTNQAIAALVFDSEGERFRPWVKLFLMRSYELMRSQATGGVQPNLNLGIIRNLQVPVPPLAEQQRIVAEVERRLSMVDRMEATVAANLKRAERMREAILLRAFAGQLVPQDPTDEPANALTTRFHRLQASRPGPGTRTTVAPVARHTQE